MHIMPSWKYEHEHKMEMIILHKTAILKLVKKNKFWNLTTIGSTKNLYEIKVLI